MLAHTQEAEKRKQVVENVQCKSNYQPQHIRPTFEIYLNSLTVVILEANRLVTMNKRYNKESKQRNTFNCGNRTGYIQTESIMRKMLTFLI